jgi:excisionase family DNA binding protein
MRFRVVVSRVQVAERFVRALNEEEAAKKVQTELERSYAFIGGWQTTATDMDVTEAPAQQLFAGAALVDSERVVLSIKDAAKHLGISRGALYEMVRTGEIRHLSIGRRKLITREALKEFIEAHSRLGMSSPQ